MKLSANLFESIVRHMKSDAAVEKDKRADPRVGISYKIDIVTVHADRRRTVQQVQLRDLSANGLGFSAPQKMTVGEQFIVELTAEDGPVWILCTVARCMKVGDFSFSVGARHAKIMRDAEIEVMAGELLNSAKAKCAKAVSAAKGKPAPVDQRRENIERIQRAMIVDRPNVIPPKEEAA